MELGVKSDKHTETDMNGNIFKAEETVQLLLVQRTLLVVMDFEQILFYSTLCSETHCIRFLSQIDQSDIAVT